MFQRSLFLLAATAILAAIPATGQQTVGLFLNDPASSQGFSVFAPLNSLETYLIDNEGKQVHSWSASANPGFAVYLMEDGALLRSSKFQPAGISRFNVGGNGGRIEMLDWNSNVTWQYDYSDAQVRQHHDIEPLPNGNVLILAWELKTSAEAIAAGRSPSLLTDGEVWPEHIIEVEPFGAGGGNVVWEWHVWDHLVQDVDPSKANFGVVADHPELVDLNFREGGNPGRADWLHGNSVDYNPDLDQIAISVRGFSEFWIIDHSTTTAEAAGHSGGNSGAGGDLLYRWGNPRSYDRGNVGDRKLYGQHDVHWIESGLPGAGNLLVLNNGLNRPITEFTTVEELDLPEDGSGGYTLVGGSAYGPAAALWTYQDPIPTDFFARNLSGSERMPNGNTLICDGPAGVFFEVDPAGNQVWRYVNPDSNNGILDQGDAAVANSMFTIRRHAASFAGLAGQDLTPGDPIEGFIEPVSVPDGQLGTEALTAGLTAPGQLHVEWDASTCPADEYNLLFGPIGDLASYGLLGAECGLGLLGQFDWIGFPAQDLYFLVVARDSAGIYEGSWGQDSQGAERNGTAPSNFCGVTNRVLTASCP